MAGVYPAPKGKCEAGNPRHKPSFSRRLRLPASAHGGRLRSALLIRVLTVSVLFYVCVHFSISVCLSFRDILSYYLFLILMTRMTMMNNNNNNEDDKDEAEE